jgi:hypothetical protein
MMISESNVKLSDFLRLNLRHKAYGDPKKIEAASGSGSKASG